MESGSFSLEKKPGNEYLIRLCCTSESTDCDVETQVRDLEAQLASSKRQEEVLRAKNKGLEDRLKDFKETMKSMKSIQCTECPQLRRELAQKTAPLSPCEKCPVLEVSVAKAQAEVECSRKYVERIETQLERTTRDLEVAKKCQACDQAAARVRETEAENTRLRSDLESKASSTCKECSCLRKTLEVTKKLLDEKQREAAKAQGATEQAREEIQRLALLGERCAASEATVAMMRPYYEEYRKRLEKGKNAVVGSDGEKGVRSILERLIGSHAEIRVTNNLTDAGDLQIHWTCGDLKRPVRITVEVKTSDGENERMIRKDYIDQARRQVQAQRADAGLLLYSHSVHPEKRIFSDMNSRLVVCGSYNESGQVLAGLFHVMTFARARVMDEEKEDGNSLSVDELSATATINANLVGQNRALRATLSATEKSIDKVLKSEKERTAEIVTSIGKLSARAASQYPFNVKNSLLLEGERMPAKRSSSSSSFSPAPKKSKTFDCFKNAFAMNK